MRTATIAVLFLMSAALTFAQTAPADYERMLLPIVAPVPVAGAFGTSWVTTTFMFNDGSEVAEYFPYDCGLPNPSLCDPVGTANPRVTTIVTARPSTDLRSGGAFLYVSRNAAARTRFAYSLHELSRDGENAGTQLPLVRERDFSHRIVLPLVPLRGPFRAALRIYGSSEAPVEATLRMYRLDRIDPFVDERIKLQGVVKTNPSPPYPSFLHVFGLVERWPQLEAAASVRMEIETIDPDQKLWAFVSITNNATQLVTIVSPQ